MVYLSLNNQFQGNSFRLFVQLFSIRHNYFGDHSIVSFLENYRSSHNIRISLVEFEKKMIRESNSLFFGRICHYFYARLRKEKDTKPVQPFLLIPVGNFILNKSNQMSLSLSLIVFYCFRYLIYQP